MNIHILTGNLGKDIEIKTLENGKKIAKATLAENEYRKKKDSDEFETITHWHNLISFGFNAEKMEKKYSQGDKVTIQGVTRTRSYENDKGEKKFYTECRVETIELMRKASKIESVTAEEVVPEQEDDLPF